MLILTGTVKTGKLCGCRDGSIRNLFTVCLAVGVEATGAWHRLMKGTGESSDVNEEKMKELVYVLALQLGLIADNKAARM